MSVYFHDINCGSVIRIDNCTPKYTQVQKNAGLVVITPEIYQYLLVQYNQDEHVVDLQHFKQLGD